MLRQSSHVQPGKLKWSGEARTSREKEGKGDLKGLAASSVQAQLLCYREIQSCSTPMNNEIQVERRLQ